MERKNVGVFFTGILTGIALVMLAMLILLFTGIADFSIVSVGNGNSSTLEREIKKKTDIIRGYIDKYYLDDIDNTTMADAVYRGIVSGLGDVYAAYYTADEYKDITEKSNGTYCGIGAYVSTDPDTGNIVIVKPMANGPAEKAGLMAGDIIYYVNDENVSGQDLSTVLSKVKGEADTVVNLKIWRESENNYLDIAVTRKLIEEDTVFFKMLTEKTGYIRVTGFEDVTSKQFENAVDTLEKGSMKSLIIDLRDNGGGLLTSTVKMLDRLLPKGLLVYTKNKEGIADEYYAEDDKCVKVPIAVLVNEHSASASEVFSGALQDESAAKLVGTKTFGKGIVQTIFNLEDGTALKMTTSKYYTPKGRNIHKTGLVPDIEVKLDSDTLSKDGKDFTIDNQMQAALDYLENS